MNFPKEENALRLARSELNAAIKAALPVGTRVTLHNNDGEYVCHGVVARVPPDSGFIPVEVASGVTRFPHYEKLELETPR